jgi:hypothetical protein
MPDERLDAIKEVMLRYLDVLETTVRSLGADIEDEELLQYSKRATQNITIVGEAQIILDQKKQVVSAGGDYVGGDKISQSAGRDMTGVAVDRGAGSGSEYSASVVIAVTTPSDLCSRIDVLADEVANGQLSTREKAILLPALIWWSEQAHNDDRPDDAEERLSPIKTATQWVRARVAVIVSSATGTVAGHWTVESVKRLIQ